MKVLFLCGGIGRRMFPITEDKFLLEFLGKTLLEHQFDLAVEYSPLLEMGFCQEYESGRARPRRDLPEGIQFVPRLR